MEEFEILRNITIGQYLALNSFIHHLDPRFKLLCFVCIVGAVTFSASLVGNAILLVVMFALIALSKIPIRYALSGLKPILPILLFLAALQILFYSSTSAPGQNCITFLQWGPINSNTCGVRFAAASIARFMELLVLVSLLTFSTTITELALGLEALLSPLQRAVNFPAHELALTLTIALRFVPTFAEELERIMKAQVSRGADFGQGRWGFIRRIRVLLPMTVPLFLSALQRAEELVLAMEARCYVGGRGRTRFIEFKSKPSDVVAFGVSLGFAVAMLLIPFPV